MNRDDVVRLAREAHHKLVTIDYPGHRGQLDAWTLALMERFAQAIEQHLLASGLVEQAVRDEREECAKECDYYATGSRGDMADECAAAIRARQVSSNSTNWICPRCKVDTRQQGCPNSSLNCPIHGIGAS